MEVSSTQTSDFCGSAAITIAKGNTTEIVDAGIQYLASYKDDAGLWLDGAKTYELIVPNDVPALNFWSVVLYDNDRVSQIAHFDQCI